MSKQICKALQYTHAEHKDTLCLLAVSTSNTNNNAQNTSYWFKQNKKKMKKTKSKKPQKPTLQSLSQSFIERSISRSISITKIQKCWKLTVNVIPREEIKFRAIIDRHLLERNFQAAAGPQQGQQRQRQRQVGAPHGGRPPPSVSSEVSLRLWMDFTPSDGGRGEGALTPLHLLTSLHLSRCFIHH